MAGGQAHGINRQYQVACRDVLMARYDQLEPWKDDGIDVEFLFPDTPRTIDIALRDRTETLGGLVVAECRRRKQSVKQGEIDAFAHQVELLRKTLSMRVAGFFIAKTGHQTGAIKVGQHNGIQTVVIREGEVPPGFTLTYLRYDREREEKLRDLVKGLGPGAATLTGSAVELRHGTASPPPPHAS